MVALSDIKSSKLNVFSNLLRKSDPQGSHGVNSRVTSNLIRQQRSPEGVEALSGVVTQEKVFVYFNNKTVIKRGEGDEITSAV